MDIPTTQPFNSLTTPHGARPKAYSYVRFSTKRQARGDSLMRQLDKSREYAAAHDLHLHEYTYEDLGVSAFDRSNVTRGALAAFIAAAESGVIERGSYLLVESLDRLSRSDLMDAVGLLSRLVKLGVRVVTVVDGRVLDEETVKEPMNVVYAVLIFIRANEESEIKADRVRKAHKRKRDNRSPFAFGQAPGWLCPNESKTGWEAIPELAKSVVKVFEYAAKGYGAVAIARRANKEGWPVPARADDWHKTLPIKLLHNRRVLGEFEPQLKSGKGRIPTGELWEGYYPAILSEELFNRANAAVERRRQLPKRRDGGYHNIFHGMLKCGHCGATLARKSKSGKKNSPGYALYVCADRDRGVTECPNWNARELEEALIPPLMQYVASDALEGAARQEARRSLEEERAALAQDKKAADNLLGTIERLGGSAMVETRLRTVEERIQERTKRIADLGAKAADPMVSVWEEDVDLAVMEAMRAVRDITSERIDEREALHQSLLRVVKQLHVWPKSHALVTLHSDGEAMLLPLSADLPSLKQAHGRPSGDDERGFWLAA